jgi:hypothetical protein
MSNPLSGTNEKPSLSDLQYLQDNWGKTEIAAAVRVAKVTVATGGDVGIEADIPVGAEIIGAETKCIRTNASGTMQVFTGATVPVAITDAMTCDTDKALTYAGEIDDANNVHIVSSDGIKVFSNAWNDGGVVFIRYAMF